MSYTLNVQKKKNYLHITVRGKNTPANVANYMMEVRNKCIEHQCPSVLIEEHLTGPGLGTFTVYDLVSEASKRDRSVVQQIAYIDTNPEHNTATMQFAETIAVNRGVNIKLFSKVSDAEKWLSEFK